MASGVTRRPPAPMMLLGNDLFLVAHDPISQRCRVADRVVGLGLAASLIGELMLFRRVTIRGDTILIAETRPTRDELANTILARLVSEQTVTDLRDWIQFLSRDAYPRVAQRMVRQGHLRAREARRPLRRRVVYEPTNPTLGGWPESRLVAALMRYRSLEPADAVLAGLSDATGLDSYILADAPAQVRDHLTRLVTDLPLSLQALIAETKSAVGDAVLSGRT